MNKYFQKNIETYKFLIENKLCRSMESYGLRNGEYYIDCDDIKIIVNKFIRHGGSRVSLVTRPTWYEFSEEGLDMIYKNTDSISGLLAGSREINLKDIELQ